MPGVAIRDTDLGSHHLPVLIANVPDVRDPTSSRVAPERWQVRKPAPPQPPRPVAERRKRRGIALLAAVSVLVTALVITAAVVTGLGRDGTEQPTNGGVVAGDNVAGDNLESGLKPGDCVAGLVGEARTPLPCTEPHEAEVFAVFTLPLDHWPGEEVVITEAEQGCQERLGAYEAALRDDPNVELVFLHPGEDSWPEGDREVVCLLRDPAGQRTGSLAR